MKTSAGNMILQETSERLLTLINKAREQFLTFDEATWNEKPSPDKWSRKEILGHLIDSAANNHLRFVNAQLADGVYKGATYEQDFFVASQQYATADTAELIELWYAYNRQLAHVIKHINIEKLNTECYIGNYLPVPLSFIITDYVVHIEHHLHEILY